MKNKLSLLLFCLAILSIQSCTFTRGLLWNIPEVTDNKKFSRTWVQASSSPWDFTNAGWADSLGETIHAFGRFSTYAPTMHDVLEESKTLAFMVIRNDSVLYEHYFDGWDKDRYYTSFSMAKSYVGMMIGIAISEGKIKSKEDPICDYLPELDRKVFGKVRLRHLLDQCSGLRFPRSWRLYYTRNVKKEALNIAVDIQPGKRFRYENGNSQLLAIILERSTGMKVEAYLEEKIWRRIGTTDPAFWSTDSKKHGEVKAFCCLNARIRDYARFGRLLLNKGNWDGDQVIPREWIDDTFSRNAKEQPMPRYKNQVWSETAAGNTFMAAGLFGQYVYICPDKNIILVKLSARNFNKHAQWSEFFSTVLEQL